MANTLSSVMFPPTLLSMSETLGQYIRSRREAMGITLTAAAERMGIHKGTVSMIELDKIGLPNPDHRRKIAKLLGVSHLDLLVAAGEISADEVTAAGASGIVTTDPGDPRTRIHALVDQVNWIGREDRTDSTIALLEAHIAADKRYRDAF